jgi:hypothetical protein
MDSSIVYLIVVMSFLCRVGCVWLQASPPTVMAPGLARPGRPILALNWGAMCTCMQPYMGRGGWNVSFPLAQNITD